MKRNRLRSECSQQIVSRFYTAYAYLRQQDMIENATDFCKMIGIDRGAFYRQKIDLSARVFDVAWLVPLVQCGISAHWLITGTGEMIKKIAPLSQ